MEDWEALEAKMVLVEMGTEQGMADALVEAIDEVQAVQVVQEELEVQDHHSHHLPPDPAALADLAHSQEVEGHWGRPLTLQECPHHREGGQRH